MTTPDPIEARLDAIEAAYAVYDDYHQDIAWLVALVRRYRRALVDALSWAEEARSRDALGTMDGCVLEIHRTLREALNEEVPP